MQQWISDSIQSLLGRSTETTTAPLQTTGTLTREQLMEFFEAGHKMFDDPMVKLKLKEAAARRQSVEGVITEMQKQIFESQGIGGVYGIAFLGKIRTVYGNDADVMHHLMKFVEREEMALDEAELTVDDFLKKLELRDWAMQQYQSMQQQMKGMNPMEQRKLIHEQQLMMKEISKESEDIVKQAENMDTEEKQKFISAQVKRLQERFQIKSASDGGSHGSECQHCSHGGTSSSPAQTAPSMGSVMTPEEQTNFFKALYSTKR